MTHPVSLPSIHEMFPAHLLRPEDEYIGRHKYQEAAPRTRCSSYPPSLANNTTNLGPTWSTPAFRVSVPPTAAVHRRPSSGPHSRSPQQRTDPDRAVPTMISFPVSASKPSPAEDASDEETPGESSGGKKHICPTCLKRFNRPSSLRIHVNTHTGATPFRCPWPSCGREFNVNSNMRRHYRNHTTPGFSRAQATDSRRKRRRVDTLPTTTTIDRHYHQANLMPPISHFSPSDDSDEYDSDTGRVERGERVEYCTKPPAYNLTQSMARVAVTKPYHHHHHHHHHDEFPPYGATSRYHQQHPDSASTATTRSFHSSSSPSSSSSSLPSPLLQPTARHHPYPAPPPVHSNNNTKRDHKYNPSAPYMHSLADTRVSTALRPAYHS